MGLVNGSLDIAAVSRSKFDGPALRLPLRDAAQVDVDFLRWESELNEIQRGEFAVFALAAVAVDDNLVSDLAGRKYFVHIIFHLIVVERVGFRDVSVPVGVAVPGVNENDLSDLVTRIGMPAFDCDETLPSGGTAGRVVLRWK